MKKLLTIAIPTFNRARRLDKALADLLEHIIRSGKQQILAVLISNNGSTDATGEVVDKYSDLYKENGISFSSHTFHENRGFDANVLNCYREADSEYVWFLSDDDNVIDNAIDSIITDIHKYAPSVLYYNFDQPPYTLDHPYNETTTLFSSVDENIQSIAKIAKWPKLTALVIKKNDGLSGEKFKNLDLNRGFMHVALALQTGLDYGMVLHSVNWIGRPDNDYMDHINFPFYVGNQLVETMKLVLHQNNRLDIFRDLNLSLVDPLATSMSQLSQYYCGKLVLTSQLKSILYSTILLELKNFKITKLNTTLVKQVLKLCVSLVYNIIHIILTRKSATRLRSTEKNNIGINNTGRIPVFIIDWIRLFGGSLLNRSPRVGNLYRIVREQMDFMAEPRATPWGFKLAGNDAMAQGTFEPAETELVRKLLQNSDVLVNVGANIGYYCCHALSAGKSVIAFEPIERNLHYLCKNIKVNGWSNVEIYPIALSDRVGVLEIYGTGTGASVLKGWAGTPENHVSLVPSSTMDVVLGDRLQGKQALVIIDIEGAEKWMLDGATNLLTNNPKPIWLIEIVTRQHQPSGVDINPNLMSTFRLFFENGYQAFVAEKDMRPITIEDIELISKGIQELDTYNFIFRETK